jgi:tripartite-type tricarboxylate transporter receptor subunit TctC
MPIAADGATDIVSRLVAAKASERIGWPIVIGNAGEAGVIGATHVARHSPDGPISPMGTVANHAINSLMASKKPDDPWPTPLQYQRSQRFPMSCWWVPGQSPVKASNIRKLIAPSLDVSATGPRALGHRHIYPASFSKPWSAST